MDNYTFKVRQIHTSEQLFTTKNGDFIHVIDAKSHTSKDFINFCKDDPNWLHQELKLHGAIILKNFRLNNAQEFESFIASLPGFKPISEAFMSEEGRVHVDNLKYVLYTNKAYKTGGTLYLGGFHSENYYSTDVPRYICFFCEKPSKIGGETGLINTQKVYDALPQHVKELLEKKAYFAKRWLLSEIAERYQKDTISLKYKLAEQGLQITQVGNDTCVDMFKPSVFHDPANSKSALQINFFQLTKLNKMLRHLFIPNYQGSAWFWHRIIWRLPDSVLKIFEYAYVIPMSIKHSYKQAWKIFWNKIKIFCYSAFYRQQTAETVESCFTETELNNLSQIMHDNYGSYLWQPGDIMLVDNTQVSHAGMPGAGPRTIRALIANKLNMRFNQSQSGKYFCDS